jgi:anthranilate phosphoribosyltransferase
VAPVSTWPTVLTRLLAGEDLDHDTAAWAMEEILSGSAAPSQVAGFVVALRAKGETAAEVQALAEVMIAHARTLDLGPGPRPIVLDVVGTGGDQAHTVNISTMAALVCAAAGAPIVKHGNRAASSSTGTADVLEELGVVIELPPEDVVTSLNRTGICFCFAQVHHPAMRHAGPTRRELGVPTVFNFLGPLTNPGRAQAALIGCASLSMAPVMAGVLAGQGVSALVVRGLDGLDEISTSAASTVWDATGDTVRESLLDPLDLGIARVDPELLRGGTPPRNALLLRKALGGWSATDVDADRAAAIRDAVAVNAAAALVAHGAAQATAKGEPVDGREVVERVAEQLGPVRGVLESGAAVDILDGWIAVTQELRRA